MSVLGDEARMSGPPPFIVSFLRRILCLTLLFLPAFVAEPKTQTTTPPAQLQKQSPSATGDGSGQGITVLEAGNVIKRDLTGGQKHSYRITLPKGQYAGLIIEHRGIDVVARLLGPEDKLIAEFDDELRVQGQERPELVAEESGSYRLEVEAKRLNAPAGNYAVRFEESHPATDQDRMLQEARRLFAESAGLWRAGKYDAALPPAAGAVEKRESALGPDHPSVAAAVNNLAIIYYLKGDLDKAESLYQRTLKIREDAFGPDHPGVAAALSNLGEIHRLRGDYAAADTLYRRSIERWEKTTGGEHPYIAYPLANLAIVRRTLGDYTEAELLYQRALLVREKALGPKDSEVASTLNNLGTLYTSKGDLIKAELMLQRALEIWEQVLGPEHPRVAAALSNLASIQSDRGDFDKAEQLGRRSLMIYEKALGPDHPDLALSLDNLATKLIDKGDLDQAEPLLQRALTIREKAQRAEHPDVAISLAYLAKLHRYRSDLNRAEQLYQRALTIREKALGPEHPGVSELLTSLSALYAARGESERAVTTQARANGIIEHNIALNLATGSERQKLAYLTRLSEITDQTLSLHARTTPDNRESCGLAVTTILQRKGRVQDAMANSLTMLRQRFNAQDQNLLDQLNGTTARLGRLVLNGPQRTTLADHQKQIKALEEQRETLESEISRRSAGFYEPTAPVTLAMVQAAIPAAAALVEFAAYHPFDPKAVESDKGFGGLGYVAYVVRRTGEIQWKDLGDAKVIDAAVNAWRSALRDPKRKDVQQLARDVDEKVMRLVRASVGDATQLLISPDGVLNLVPFAALVDEQGRYLAERYSISYLTSGRDLLRLQARRQSQSPPVVLADPWFGEPEIMKAGGFEAPTVKQAATNRKRQSMTTGVRSLGGLLHTSERGSAGSRDDPVIVPGSYCVDRGPGGGIRIETDRCAPSAAYRHARVLSGRCAETGR